MADMPNETRKRLTQLREALGLGKTEFAHRIGVSPQRWGNIENGTGAVGLPKEVAFRIYRSVPGVTLDWLYFGDTQGLPIHMARLLRELPPEAVNGHSPRRWREPQ